MDKETSIEDIKKEGEQRGRSIASWVDIPEAGKTYKTESDGNVTVESVAEAEIVMADLASQSEENNRQFSPFEFTAHAINERDDADKAWEAYNDAIHEGINACITERLGTYTDADFDGTNAEV